MDSKRVGTIEAGAVLCFGYVEHIETKKNTVINEFEMLDEIKEWILNKINMRIQQNQEQLSTVRSKRRRIRHTQSFDVIEPRGPAS